MPLYNVEHSFPLNAQQKTDLAERITNLHAQAFTTPSIFVQVSFHQHDASAQNNFLAGKPLKQSLNRIIAYVRSSSSRTKENFDKLAEDVEHAWYVVVGERIEAEDEKEKKKKEKEQKETPESEKIAKELMSVAFVTGIVVREKGYAIPEVSSPQSSPFLNTFT